MRIIKLILIILMSFFSLCEPIIADTDEYMVYDLNSEFSISFSSLQEAQSYYNQHLDEYDNLILNDNDDVILMEYGFIEFNSDSARSLMSEYYSLSRHKTDYINGCYGIDAPCLKIDLNLNRAYFLLGNDYGYIDLDEVKLHPYGLDFKPSLYVINDNALHHLIKSQMQYENYGLDLVLDDAPEYLKEGNLYFSYDGHYFYDDYFKMIDDYQNGTYTNAINDEPYYNYYQYLSSRSITNYSLSEIEDYFYNTLGINGRLTKYLDNNFDGANDEINKSELYNNLEDFFICQDIYGNNALMLLSSAINESSYGKSLSAYLNNNFYVTSAYDNDYERDNDCYIDISKSIYAHGKYIINEKLSNHFNNIYSGTHFGDKLSGLTAEYSLDPYYGEKSASNYYLIDKALGYKDKDYYRIGIIKDEDKVNLYADPYFNDRLYYLQNVEELALLIIGEQTDTYMVQIDTCNNEDYLYNYDECVAYIDKNAFTYVFNEQNNINLDCYNYDFNGGSFLNFDELSIYSKEFRNITPKLDGYEFNGYELVDDKYVAKYREIDSIAINYLPSKQLDTNGNLDLTDGMMTVKYRDGGRSKYPINSDNIYEFNKENNEIIIDYCGIKKSKSVKIGNYFEKYDKFADAINNEDYEYLKNNIKYLDYPLTMNELRNIDQNLKILNKRNYVIKDNTNNHDVSISGLDLSLESKENFKFIDDTYYVEVNDIGVFEKNDIEKYGKAYGFESVEGINIRFKFNFSNINLIGPAIVQLDVDNKANDSIYTVYHIDSKGNIIKCKTSQSNNYVQFMIHDSGDYLLLRKDCNNIYNLDDYEEDLSIDNMGYDNHMFNLKLMFAVLLYVISFGSITIYYIVSNTKEKMWRDYKKSYLIVESVQEEKPKN